MAHYAFIDERNIVVKVIVGVDETVTQNGIGGSTEAWEQFYENQPWHSGLTCKRTSYNGNFRGVYAGIDYAYDAEADVFVPPQPYPSWTLDENHNWQPPILMPTDGKLYSWFEPNQQWIEITES